MDISKDQIIAREFWLPGSPLRRLLIAEMMNQPYLRQDTMIDEIYNNLTDNDCYIKGAKWTQRLCSLFSLLHKKGYDHMLSRLVNKTCAYPDRSMFGEHVAYDLQQKERLQQRLNDINEQLLDSKTNSIELQGALCINEEKKYGVDRY